MYVYITCKFMCMHIHTYRYVDIYAYYNMHVFINSFVCICGPGIIYSNIICLYTVARHCRMTDEETTIRPIHGFRSNCEVMSLHMHEIRMKPDAAQK